MENLLVSTPSSDSEANWDQRVFMADSLVTSTVSQPQSEQQAGIESLLIAGI